MQSYRIAMGPHQGRKAFTLQTLPARTDERLDSALARAAGFSLHCGVAAAAHQREKLERLCRLCRGLHKRQYADHLVMRTSVRM